MGAAEEFVGAIATPAHLALQLGRRIGDEAIFRVNAGLLTEPTANITHQHADAVFRPLEDRFRQHIARGRRRLRLDM